MIEREIKSELLAAASEFPAVTLTGPRQSGKSTLCRSVFAHLPYANLEATDTRAYANNDPRGFLSQFPDGAIIDEIQRAPDITSYLQGIIDENPSHGRWILTGSQNLSLLQSVSQSLAGRTAVLHLLPLTFSEVMRFGKPPMSLDETLCAGGYPRIFEEQQSPEKWARAYVNTYIERDVRTMAQIRDFTVFGRFLELCAGRTAQLLNYSSLASDCGITQPTAKAWLNILETSFILFRLQPFHSNLRKRIIKMPKLHFYDTGLVCWLLGIRAPDQLRSHPLRGTILESWVVSEIVKHRTNVGHDRNISFYRDRDGVEADLVIETPGKLKLVEVKAGQTATSKIFDGPKRVKRLLSNPTNKTEINIVYGGDALQERTESTLLPWNQVHTRDWTS